MECFCGLGHLLRVGSIICSFLHLRFDIGWGLGNCQVWAHSCFTRLGDCVGPKSLGRCYSFPPLCGLVFPDIGVSVQLRGPILAAGRLGYWTHFPFNFQQCSHFLDYCWVGAESCAPWGTFNYLGHSVSPKNMCPLHRGNLHLHVHHFHWESTSKVAI